jgi:L-threonylcarbamoyladenylate synthase
MSARFDCADPAQRAAGLAEAAVSLRKGELAVLPTDTVYGVAADAFSPPAVAALQAVRGSGRHAPPAVLVGSTRAAAALAGELSVLARELIDEFWPGGLTLVFPANRSLAWDLGDTRGTVAVRMPLHPVALDVLRDVGPLAVSSASRLGMPPPTTASEAQAQLGEAVAVYLDDGPCPGPVVSTIVDMTGPEPRLLRQGVVGAWRLREVMPLLSEDGEPGETAGGEPDSELPGSEPPGTEPPGSEPPGTEPPGSEPDSELPGSEPRPGSGAVQAAAAAQQAASSADPPAAAEPASSADPPAAAEPASSANPPAAAEPA